ncbi:MAG: response regulator [Halobacteriaceae archaeon]
MDNSMLVLHIDDEPDFAEMAAEFLEREDDRLVVETATSAKKGLDSLKEQDIDCIVSDYDMPEMNGIKLLKSIREEHPNIPFILYTGKGSEEVASEAISADVTDYLQKESGTEQYELLANRITNAVAQTRAKQRAEEQARILSILRDVNQALVQSTTQNEIEDAVTDILASSEGYQISWIGEYDTNHDRVVPRTIAGISENTVSPINTSDIDPSDSAILRSAATHEITVTSEPGTTFTVWDTNDLRPDYDAGIVIPLVYRSERYGLLVLYATDGDIINEAERDMLEELAGDIGQAMYTAATRQDLQLHQTAVKTVPEGVFILDEDATIELINESAANLLDRDPSSVQGEAFPTFVEAGIFDEGIIDWYLDSVREMLSSQSERDEAWYETNIHLQSGESRHIEIHLTLRPYEETYRGTVGVIRDITDRKHREQALEQKNERLEKFASIVSHDLRSPLNVAQGRLELVNEECNSDHLDDVIQAVDRSIDIIDDLSTLAEEGYSNLEIESVKLADMVSRCWQNVETADATLYIETEQIIRADPSQLQQLLENLIGNAVEHGGQDISIRVGALEDGFYVADDGSGIPDKDREKVFEEGYSTTEGGTGLGLSIVKDIVTEHTWEIELLASSEGGARFEITNVDIVNNDLE